MDSKYWHWFSGFTITLAYAVLLTIGVMMFWPFNPITLYPDTYQTLKAEYRQGEQLTVWMHYDKRTKLPATVVRAFSDGIVYQLPVTVTHNPMGKQKFINQSVQVPDNLPPGKYVLKALVTYKVNPLREISYSLETNEFEVTAK